MAVSYKELGLVNTKEMFADAIKNGYAVPAYNFNNLEQLQAIVQACTESKSPVILQISKGARNYANATILRYLAVGAVEFAKELGCNIPIHSFCACFLESIYHKWVLNFVKDFLCIY